MKESMKAQLATSLEYFQRSTRCLDEEDSGHAPAPGVFTAANQVAHTAHTVEWFLDGAFSPDGFDMGFEAAEEEVRSYDSLTDARAYLERAFARALELVDARSEAEWAAPLPEGPIMGGLPRHVIVSGIVEHTAHHRGALTVYSRTLGKTPNNPYMDT